MRDPGAWHAVPVLPYDCDVADPVERARAIRGRVAVDVSEPQRFELGTFPPSTTQPYMM